MKPRSLSETDHERIAEMREDGMTMSAIAAAIGCSISTVNWQCLRLGAEPPNPRRLSIEVVGPAVMKRGDHVVRRFTGPEDAQLLELREGGLSVAAISRRMGRRMNSVRGRLMTLARREARMEACA